MQLKKFLTHTREDLTAGVTAATVILPKSLAYASVAGLSVAVGLYTSFIPLIVYALLGTSQILSVTSTTTIAILTAAEIQLSLPNADPAQALAIATTLTMAVGILLVLASVFRLGFVANFISTPVLIGFKAGIGCVILVDQIPKLLGLHFAKQDFFSNVFSIFSGLPQTSLITLAAAVASFALFFAISKILPKFPAALMLVAISILASWLRSEEHTSELQSH